MSTHKYIDKICCVFLALMLLITAVLSYIHRTDNEISTASFGYETTLFDTSVVHNLNIIIDDWDTFLSTCENEEYVSCTAVIDNETFKNVAIRAKGNSSLTQVSSYGNQRYSFKIEFDHYDDAITYHGLDKLILNNIIQDDTYMKDFLSYQMMRFMGVPSPLCSFIYITVNGEDWGLYLAVESLEESFLQRNYGNNYGNLYKPESTKMNRPEGFEDRKNAPDGFEPGKNAPDGFKPDHNMPDDFDSGKDIPERFHPTQENGKGDINNPFDEKASKDVMLQYIDDEIDSYENIFHNAKTPVSTKDKKRLIQALKNLSDRENLSETLDIDEIIRYFVVHNFVLNSDSYTGSMVHNYYLYEKDGTLQMLPWDYNLAFGAFEHNKKDTDTKFEESSIDEPVSGGNIEDRPMIAWIFEDEEYTELYHQYFNEFLSSFFDSGEFDEMYDHTIALISPYVMKDPTKFCTYETFEKESSALKEFCITRAAFLGTFLLSRGVSLCHYFHDKGTLLVTKGTSPKTNSSTA